jgi:hypothetical protein
MTYELVVEVIALVVLIVVGWTGARWTIGPGPRCCGDR